MKRIGVLPSAYYNDIVDILKDFPAEVRIFVERKTKGEKSQSLIAQMWSFRYGRRDLSEIISWLKSEEIDLVLTLDNNPVVSRLASLVETPIVVIQHGVRRVSPPRGKVKTAKNLTFCSYGGLQISDFLNNLVPAWPNALHAIAPNRILPVGSLRDDLAVSRSHTANEMSRLRKFDLCLVSQFKGNQPRELHNWETRQQAISTTAKWTGDFVRHHDLKLIVAGYGDTPEQIGAEEEWLYQELDCDFEFESPRTELSSHLATEAAAVTVGVHSSVIWETFGRRRRVLSVNPTGEKEFNFPIPGPWTVQTGQFGEFCRTLESLLEMTDGAYESQIGGFPEQIALFRPKEPVRERVYQELNRILSLG